MFVNFPQIYCSKHPSYQLNLICRHPNCKNKGAICCRCQLKYHSDNGHTFESFIPLDEVIILCEQQNPKAEYFDDLSLDGIIEIEQLQQSLQSVNDSIKNQLKKELLMLGQFQKPFKDIFGVMSHYQQFDGNNTRTDDGLQGGLKMDFLSIMSHIAEKISLIDGEFCIDQSEMNNCVTEIIDRKRKNLQILKKLNENCQSQCKIIQTLFNYGISFGTDQHLPVEQFNDWIPVLNVGYFEQTTYNELITLPIKKQSIVIVGFVRNKFIEFCAIDKYEAIFEGQINEDSELKWKLNEQSFGCQCFEWNLIKIDSKSHHETDRRIIYYK